MLKITRQVFIPVNEIHISAVRAQGPGGQNVNKVSTAVQLRFDVPASSLPELHKTRLLALHDRRISSEGVVVIKAQRYRSLERNRQQALLQLQTLVKGVTTTPKKRIATRPTKASKIKRLDTKGKRGKIKSLRAKVVV
jgi:ribosome-associated protein